MRLFLAIRPDRPTVELLGSLPRPRRDGVRWTGSDHWHVTLVFLGAVAPEPAVRALSDMEASSDPLAELGPASRLLNRTVLVLPVAGLERLANSAQTACRRAGLDLEERPFRGHLTLARGRRPGDLDGLAGGAVSARFTVAAVELVSSTRVPGGGPNRYEVLGHRSLGDRRE